MTQDKKYKAYMAHMDIKIEPQMAQTRKKSGDRTNSTPRSSKRFVEV
jgi:hypothetical protein